MADVARPHLRGQRQESGPLERLMALIRRVVPAGGLTLATVTFVSFGIGLLKSKVLSHSFGAGTETDAFNAAFALPGLALEVLVTGGLIASFVPIYIGLKDEKREDAQAFAQTIFTLGLLSITAVMALMALFAPECIAFTTGFTGHQRDLAIDLFRILTLTQILFAATWVLGEVLIAEKQWLVYAVAPIMYSGGIIVGSLVLGDTLGIYGAAIGAVGGAVLYLAIRLYGAWRIGFRPVPSFSLRVKGLRKYAELMWPKMLSQPWESTLVIFYFTALATRLQPGSLTTLTYAREFQTLPELVIGAQFAIAAFPALSTAADMGNRREFRRIFTNTLGTIAVLSTAAALGLMTLGWLAVQIVLGGGAFDAADVRTTTLLVGVFAVSIPLESMVELVARGVYATRNTKIPAVGSVAGFATLFVVSQLLAPAAGLIALPAGYAAGMAVKLAIVAAGLAPRMDRIGRPATDSGLEPVDPRVMARRAGAPAVSASRRGPRPRVALGIAAALVIVVAGLYTGIQALNGASFGYAPEVTPWARVRPTEDLATPTIEPSIVTSPDASATPSGEPTASATPAGPTPTPTPSGQYSMDLYQTGDFVGEFKNTHCVPAATQTMMNIMDEGADTTSATQDKLFALGNSIAESRNGSPDPEGWSGGLQQLGYGNYKVDIGLTMDAALKTVVKQIRLTNRPAGLLVWYGWHSWVVSGFVTDADPAVTDAFHIKALYIEDVWYNRHSTLWNKSRGGYSRPPDSLVPYNELSQDYKRWDQAVYYRGKQNNWVFVIPY